MNKQLTDMVMQQISRTRNFLVIITFCVSHEQYLDDLGDVTAQLNKLITYKPTATIQKQQFNVSHILLQK